MRKRCRRCGVMVDGELSNCPLCGAYVVYEQMPSIHGERPVSIYEYPDVQERAPKQRFLQWSMFVSLMAIAIAIVVDLIVNRKLSWSLHVLFGVVLPWLCIARPLLLNFNFRKHLTWGFLGVTALLFYLNAWTSGLSNPWAFWLGAPVTVLVWQSVLEISCLKDKRGRADYEMSLTKLCVFSLICIGISFLWLKECTWGWYVSAVRGAIDVVALAIFGKHDYFGELKRRLHV